MTKNWYVIHTYAGFEGRVKTSLMERANQMGLVEKLGQVLVPTEDVIEIKDGKRRTSRRKFFPGYVLVEIETFSGVSASDQYHGLRTAQEESIPVTDVPGLGQGAYTRIDPQTGPHLTVYDGNLYLEIAALGVTTSTNQADL